MDSAKKINQIEKKALQWQPMSLHKRVIFKQKVMMIIIMDIHGRGPMADTPFHPSGLFMH